MQPFRRVLNTLSAVLVLGLALCMTTSMFSPSPASVMASPLTMPQNRVVVLQKRGLAGLIAWGKNVYNSYKSYYGNLFHGKPASAEVQTSQPLGNQGSLVRGSNQLSPIPSQRSIGDSAHVAVTGSGRVSGTGSVTGSGRVSVTGSGRVSETGSGTGSGTGGSGDNGKMYQVSSWEKVSTVMNALTMLAMVAGTISGPLLQARATNEANEIGNTANAIQKKYTTASLCIQMSQSVNCNPDAVKTQPLTAGYLVL